MQILETADKVKHQRELGSKKEERSTASLAERLRRYQNMGKNEDNFEMDSPLSELLDAVSASNQPE